MICPACSSDATKVVKSLDSGTLVQRRRECACGARWTTEERLVKGTLVASGGQQAPPMARKQPPVATNGAEGVGGGLSGDRSDPVRSGLDPIPSLSPDQGVDRARAKRPRKDKAKPVESTAFVAWYAEYPRKVKRDHAAAMWNEAELDAIADKALAALRSQLAFWRAQPIDKVPHPGSWIGAKRWTDDPASYAIGAVNGGRAIPPDTRCTWHRDPRNDARASKYPDKRCERCKHFLARDAGRTGEVEVAADVLPLWAQVPPPAPWTPEQIAEAEELRKAGKTNTGRT